MQPATGFRNPTDLTNATKGFLYANLALILVSVPAIWRDYRWLENTGEAAPSLEGLSGSLVGLALAATALVGFVTAILVLNWIHRAAYNARQLGATWMEFTPGWAVGWYFIPIASLWKPYQAMKEIWLASHSPSRASKGDEDRPALLPLWWGLWLVTFFGAEGASWTVSTEAAENLADVVREVLRIPLTLVLLSIISRVHSVQMAHYRTQAVDEQDSSGVSSTSS